MKVSTKAAIAISALCATFNTLHCTPALSEQTPPASTKSSSPSDQTPSEQAKVSTPSEQSPGTKASAVSAPPAADATTPAADIKASDGNTNPITQALEIELKRNFSGLKAKGKTPLYFLAYKIYDGNWVSISATDGALEKNDPISHWRMLSIDLRVGSPKLDNTHFLRGDNLSAPTFYDNASNYESILPLAGASLPLRQCLWLKTDDAFKQAQRRYFELCGNTAVMSTEEDKSGDFCSEPPHLFTGTEKSSQIDQKEWEKRIKTISSVFLKYPAIQHSTVSFDAQQRARYIVNTEGSRIIEPSSDCNVSITAHLTTNDGMNLSLWRNFHAPDPSILPNEAELTEATTELAKNLELLKQAPAAESFAGPAILSGRAAAVFFHETFGHRVEAVHEKSETEGKTFAKRIGTQIMPNFISVIDDPTASKAYDKWLNGHYVYDDEGVPGQKVVLAKNGILTGFLLNRVPIQNFHKSNGHGRSSPGWNPTARQSNLFVIVDKEKQVSQQALRAQLIAEARKQHKPYGLFFDQISGGSTSTNTRSEQNQTYQIKPLLVYKVFVDGHPDELIRGADIVGTPLTALERIIGASNQPEVFNGICYRESGNVPVSAISPALLIQSIEIRRTARNSQRSPILPAPPMVPGSASISNTSSSNTTAATERTASTASSKDDAKLSKAKSTERTK